MTGKHQTETNLEGESTAHQEEPATASVEAAYEHLAGYGFARRYVAGKTVANIGREGVERASRLLAESAESLTNLSTIREAADQASAAYDVVVALGVMEDLDNPQELLREARRILKDDGVLIVSATDKQTNTIERNPGANNGRRSEMYVCEFKRMLEGHFGGVRIYRQGAVAGGMVFPLTQEEVGGAPVEVARFSLSDLAFSVEPPTTRSVIAVCSDAAEALGDEVQPYLLLDRDRRVFDECEERAEDVELLRGEIQQMQETEVQAFVDAVRIRYSLIQELPRYLPHMRNILLAYMIHRQNIIRGNLYAIRRKGAKGLLKGVFRRSVAFYRRLKTRDSD